MSGEGAIERLDDETVRRIAAGEVVERPASAVKELVENSLDAGAARVAVRVDGDGTDLLRVRDDGAGMTADELRVAVEEHTTSKIGSADDLDGLATLGFRGEALYTIGAVSRLEVRSRPPGADQGHRVVVDNGSVGGVEPAACPPGTVVAVHDLFGETPARRKFLGQPSTEFDHVNRVVSQYALANPDVAVSLSHDERETFATDGRGNLRSAVLAVYGREVAESMVGVDADPEEAAVDRVGGLVSHPETTRASRDYLATFVNGRYVPAAALREAVVEGYGGQLAADRYPFAVLFVEVSPGAVDANVHPRKTEVRFDDPGAVRSAVTRAVEAALVDHGLVRSGAPRGRSQPSETRVAPSSADADGPDADAARSGGSTDGREPASERSADADEDAEPDRSADPAESATGDDAPEASSPGQSGDGAADASAPDARAGRSAPAWSASADDETATGDGAAVSGDDTDPPRRPGRGVAPTRQRTLDGESPGVREFERLPPMRILGQLHDTYVVAETPDGLVLVDQHAADERVNYERLRGLLAGDAATQALAEPTDLELTAREAALFEAHAEALASLGFHATRTGERTVEVRTVPAALDEPLDPSLLRDALADLREGGESRTVEAVADDLLADLACHPSVTGNTSLGEGSVLSLLGALDDCENPYACPHGRPTVVRVDREELEDRFERDYPGHGRRAE
jgi:DNA mismatch repair protein MutL